MISRKNLSSSSLFSFFSSGVFSFFIHFTPAYGFFFFYVHFFHLRNTKSPARRRPWMTAALTNWPDGGTHTCEWTRRLGRSSCMCPWAPRRVGVRTSPLASTTAERDDNRRIRRKKPFFDYSNCSPSPTTYLLTIRRLRQNIVCYVTNSFTHARNWSCILRRHGV